MDRNIDILQLRDELEQLLGSRIIQENNALALSLYTLDRNYEELQELLVAAEARIDLNMFDSYRDNDTWEVIDREIVRRLHNFVAAALSLIDHTRRLYEKLYGSDKRFQDYEERKNQEFVNDPLAQFVRYLRQYCQHYQAPNLRYTVNIEPPYKLEKVITLAKEDLLTFNGWNAAAKKYLTTVTREVHIRTVAEAYITKIRTFYTWFHDRQEDIYAEEIAAFRRMEAEILLLQLDREIVRSMGQNDQYIFNPDHAFFNIFTPKEIRHLESIPMDEAEHVAIAIALLKRHLVVPDDMKDKIRKLYQTTAPPWIAHEAKRKAT